MKYLLALILTFSFTASAEPEVHAGVGAGLNTAFYLLCSGAMGREVGLIPGCLVTSSLLTGMVGFLSEINDAKAGPIDGTDLAADAIGIGISALFIYTLDIHGKKDDNKPRVGFSNNRVTIGWRF